jgi:hypothetical protein
VRTIPLHVSNVQTIAGLVLRFSLDRTSPPRIRPPLRPNDKLPFVAIALLAVLFVTLISAWVLPLDPGALQPTDIAAP